MRLFAVFLIIFGLIIIAYPEFLAYLIGGFFLFIGLNIFFIGLVLPRKKTESFVKFGNYKIFR